MVDCSFESQTIGNANVVFFAQHKTRTRILLADQSEPHIALLYFLSVQELERSHREEKDHWQLSVEYLLTRSFPCDTFRVQKRTSFSGKDV